MSETKGTPSTHPTPSPKPQSQAPPTLETLPTEILLKILTNLNPAHASLFSYSSPRIREIFRLQKIRDHKNSLYEEITLPFFDEAHRELCTRPRCRRCVEFLLDSGERIDDLRNLVLRLGLRNEEGAVPGWE